MIVAPAQADRSICCLPEDALDPHLLNECPAILGSDCADTYGDLSLRWAILQELLCPAEISLYLQNTISEIAYLVI